MSVNEYVPEEIAKKIEDAVVSAYTPGITQEECADNLGVVVETIAHLLMSPNGTFQWPGGDVQSFFRSHVDKAAERAFTEQATLWDLANGYKHCDNREAHDRHDYAETVAGAESMWECSGRAVKPMPSEL